MTQKARYIHALPNRNLFDKHAWEHTDLLYEYRGHEYIVTRHNNGYFGESLAEQHKKEQARIDKMLDEPETVKQWTYEGSAQEGFDLFWKYIEEE